MISSGRGGRPGPPDAPTPGARARAGGAGRGQPRVHRLDPRRDGRPGVVLEHPPPRPAAELARQHRPVQHQTQRPGEGVDPPVRHHPAVDAMGQALGRAGEGDDRPSRGHVVEQLEGVAGAGDARVGERPRRQELRPDRRPRRGDEPHPVLDPELCRKVAIGGEGGGGEQDQLDPGPRRRELREGAQQQVDALIGREVASEDDALAGWRGADRGLGGGDLGRDVLDAVADHGDVARLDPVPAQKAPDRVGGRDDVVGPGRQRVVEPAPQTAEQAVQPGRAVVGQLRVQQRVRVVDDPGPGQPAHR